MAGFYKGRPNGILRDTGLSLKTKGLFAIILSLPEDWDYSVAGLATVAGCGRDAIRSALGEMETAGYLRRTRSHGEDGKFAGVIYDIRDVAAPLSENPTMEEDAPLSGKPTSAEPTLEKPSSENPTQLNKDISNKDLINPHSPPPGDKPQRKKRRPKSAPTWHPERFEGFWRAYPRDEDRAKAVEQWDKLPEDQALVKRYGSEEALLHDIAVGLGTWTARTGGKAGASPTPSAGCGIAGGQRSGRLCRRSISRRPSGWLRGTVCRYGDPGHGGRPAGSFRLHAD